MLLSMTGHGQGMAEGDGITSWTEIRAVNNRFLKVTLVCPDRLLTFQAEIENLVRKHIHRGTITVMVRIRRADSQAPVQVDAELLRSLQAQLRELATDGEQIPISALLSIPGAIVDSPVSEEDLAADWKIVSAATESALQSLDEMRRNEGQTLADDILSNCQSIMRLADEISGRAPLVVEAYSQRLTSRINQMLSQFSVSVSPADVVREIGIFADRCDISEELVRIDSHCEQFVKLVKQGGNNSGRRLDFLTQELLREANTIGSKAGDAEIGSRVVEIKTAIERIREMVQNIE